MRNFLQVASGADTLPLLHAIQRQPGLWNANRIRTTFDNSPHAEVDDILLRFEDLTEEDAQSPDLNTKIENVERKWQPAWDALPETRALIGPLMLRVGAYELARCMITRLAPGGVITPHADTQGEYANLPDIARYHVVLQGEPGSLFNAGNETVMMQTGEVWWFNAHAVHSVVNNSAQDRIHLLVDVRLM